MSDSFADLWNSSAPPKSTDQSKTLGSATLQSTVPVRRPPQDVFSLLASSSTPSSRPLTPLRSSPQLPMKPTSGDAFSDLLSGTLSASPKIANMTIAERAAQVEKEKSADLRKRANKQQESAWDGLDVLGLSKPSQPKVTAMPDDWDFGALDSTMGSSKVVRPNPNDDWGLSHMGQVYPSSSTSPSPAHDHEVTLILDNVDQAPSGFPGSQPPNGLDLLAFDQRPGDSDGHDRLLGHDSDDESDILGALSRPINRDPNRSSPSVNTSSLPNASLVAKSSSPPPHIVGQLVEMGFSPQQARIALAATDTGMDVQAAAETLLAQAFPNRPTPEVENAPRHRSPSPGADSAAHRNRRHADTTPSNAHNLLLQEQADRLLSQASELGLSMFNKANAIWASGRDKALKVYEEHAKAVVGSAAPPGRPKWMKEMPANDEEQNSSRRDPAMAPPSDITRCSQPPPPSRQSEQLSRTDPLDLFPDSQGARPPPPDKNHPRNYDDSMLSHRASSPMKQKTVVASNEALSTSARNKASGNEKFKLGQFGEAESAYSAAIASLPDDHLLLVPLYNNRAAARLKIGDCAGAGSDASAVITLIGPAYNPDLEPKVVTPAEGTQIDLGDGLVKAWKRRAEALEAREKWADACQDWKSLAKCAWARSQTREEAEKGVTRCQCILNDDGVEGKRPPKSRTSLRPKSKHDSRRSPSPPSQALTNLRKATSALEDEEDARFELKDAVDARLQAWKGGKETNIRALIASLDTVLWPELGWAKVGMGELVSEKQVKIRYTKAIAKLHPDKLNATNITLEQRMVANGIFGVLNEAWHNFKQ